LPAIKIFNSSQAKDLGCLENVQSVNRSVLDVERLLIPRRRNRRVPTIARAATWEGIHRSEFSGSGQESLPDFEPVVFWFGAECRAGGESGTIDAT
jgi:hypothetical protein